MFLFNCSLNLGRWISLGFFTFFITSFLAMENTDSEQPDEEPKKEEKKLNDPVDNKLDLLDKVKRNSQDAALTIIDYLGSSKHKNIMEKLNLWSLKDYEPSEEASKYRKLKEEIDLLEKSGTTGCDKLKKAIVDESNFFRSFLKDSKSTAESILNECSKIYAKAKKAKEKVNLLQYQIEENNNKITKNSSDLKKVAKLKLQNQKNTNEINKIENKIADLDRSFSYVRKQNSAFEKIEDKYKVPKKIDLSNTEKYIEKIMQAIADLRSITRHKATSVNLLHNPYHKREEMRKKHEIATKLSKIEVKLSKEPRERIKQLEQKNKELADSKNDLLSSLDLKNLEVSEKDEEIRQLQDRLNLMKKAHKKERLDFIGQQQKTKELLHSYQQSINQGPLKGAAVSTGALGLLYTLYNLRDSSQSKKDSSKEKKKKKEKKEEKQQDEKELVTKKKENSFRKNWKKNN